MKTLKAKIGHPFIMCLNVLTIISYMIVIEIHNNSFNVFRNIHMDIGYIFAIISCALYLLVIILYRICKSLLIRIEFENTLLFEVDSITSS